MLSMSEWLQKVERAAQLAPGTIRPRAPTPEQAAGRTGTRRPRNPATTTGAADITHKSKIKSVGRRRKTNGGNRMIKGFLRTRSGTTARHGGLYKQWHENANRQSFTCLRRVAD